jgi:hypothetical protein
MVVMLVMVMGVGLCHNRRSPEPSKHHGNGKRAHGEKQAIIP